MKKTAPERLAGSAFSGTSLEATQLTETRSYWVLSAEESVKREVCTEELITERSARGELLSVLDRSARGVRLIPAFQFDPRLDLELFTSILDLYRRAGVDLTLSWDFFRTVHKPLGGLTGVDVLLGFCGSEYSALSRIELREWMLELAEEDLARSKW